MCDATEKGENLTRGLHVREIAWLEPHIAAARLRPLGELAFLDSAMRHSTLGRYSYVTAAPFGRLVVEHGKSYWNGEHTGKDPLYELAQLMRRFSHQSHNGLPPFQTGSIGFFSYEMGQLIERVPRPAAAGVGPVPEIMLGFYDVVVAFDQIENRAWIISSGYPEKDLSSPLARARERAALIEARLALDVSRARGPAPPIPRSAGARTLNKIVTKLLSRVSYITSWKEIYSRRMWPSASSPIFHLAMIPGPSI